MFHDFRCQSFLDDGEDGDEELDGVSCFFFCETETGNFLHLESESDVLRWVLGPHCEAGVEAKALPVDVFELVGQLAQLVLLGEVDFSCDDSQDVLVEGVEVASSVGDKQSNFEKFFDCLLGCTD